jgi:hypothetical protein
MAMSETNWLKAGVVLLFAAQTQAWAQTPLPQDAAGGLTIHIRNFSDLDESTVAAAARDAQRIFQRANLPVRVRVDHMQLRDGERKPTTPFTTRRTDLVANILTPEMAATLPVAKDVLGVAPGAEQKNRNVVYVFAHRVKELSRMSVRTVRGGGPAWIASESRVLAYGVAHEIGHLLLSSSAHPDGGIMRANWRYSEILAAVTMNLRFSPNEVETMRRETARRVSLAQRQLEEEALQKTGEDQPRP